MAATDTSKPRLNVPAAMAGSLRLDAAGTTSPARSSAASRLFDLPKTPSPSKVTYSDRFIPCRSSSRLHNFALTSPSSSNKNSSAAAPETPYTRLLRAELFPDSSPGGNPDSPNNNLFRFKTDHSAPSSPFASADKNDGAVGSGNSTPKKAPRKVPKTPHKVLDAPSLLDDFYLNLVDWSSQNMLAVGLGTCVYLWSASSSKVTKLCDLGPRDSVCAVHWTREGSYLAVGTSLGDVQVCFALSPYYCTRCLHHQFRICCSIQKCSPNM